MIAKIKQLQAIIVVIMFFGFYVEKWYKLWSLYKQYRCNQSLVSRNEGWVLEFLFWAEERFPDEISDCGGTSTTCFAGTSSASVKRLNVVW